MGLRQRIQSAVQVQGALPLAPEVLFLDAEEDVLPWEPLLEGAAAAGVELPVQAGVAHGGPPIAAIAVRLEQQGCDPPIPRCQDALNEGVANTVHGEFQSAIRLTDRFAGEL